VSVTREEPGRTNAETLDSILHRQHVNMALILQHVLILNAK